AHPDNHQEPTRNHLKALVMRFDLCQSVLGGERAESTSWGSLVRAQYQLSQKPLETAGFFFRPTHPMRSVFGADGKDVEKAAGSNPVWALKCTSVPGYLA